MDKFYAWFNRVLNWYIRHRRASLRIAAIAATTGIAMVVAARYSVTIELIEGFPITLGFEEGAAPLLVSIFGYFFLLLCFIVLIYEFYMVIGNDKSQRRILISFIGLDPILSNPPVTAIQKKYGKVERHEINILRYMKSRCVADPDGALSEVSSSIKYIKNNVSNTSPEDASYIFAGLGPGPLLLAAGYLFSNKNSIELWDYDRDRIDASKWHSLDGVPFNASIIFPAVPEELKNGPVALLISFTFKVNKEDVIAMLGDIPMLEISLSNTKNDALNSLEDQLHFQMRFRNIVNELASKGVSVIHLFCSSQASVYFRIGQQIDGNHPDVVIYQYTPDQKKKFSWGVSLNNHLANSPSIIYTDVKQ